MSVTLVYCGQTVGWIGMLLDTEVGIGPGDIVLDGDPAPPALEKGYSPPIFGPCLLIYWNLYIILRHPVAKWCIIEHKPF